MENARRPRPKPEFGGGALERRSISEQVDNRILSIIKSGNLESGDRLPPRRRWGTCRSSRI
jgi:GntR family transcriptional repressor for pyruvate dehydrogenase complex